MFNFSHDQRNKNKMKIGTVRYREASSSVLGWGSIKSLNPSSIYYMNTVIIFILLYLLSALKYL